MHAHGTVAEQQFDPTSRGNSEALQLLGVGGELQQRCNPGMPGEFGVLQQPATVALAHDEVGEPEEGDICGGRAEVGVKERGLKDDFSASAESEPRVVGGGLEGGAVHPLWTGNFDHRLAEPVPLKYPLFVLVTEPGRAFEHGVDRVGHDVDAAEPRVDAAQEGKFANGCSTQVTCTRHHAAVQ